MWTQMIPAALTLAGTFTSAGGSWMAGSAAREEGERRKVAAQFEAEQLEQQAGQAAAAAQRMAEDEARKARLVQSRAIAVAAASGGGVSDPTIVNLLGRIAGEGAYRQAVALYQGEEKARTLKMSAAGKRFEGEMAEAAGRQKQTAYRLAAAGSLLVGSGSLYSRYGMGGPAKLDAGETILDAGTPLDTDSRFA